MAIETKTKNIIPLTDWLQRVSEGPRNAGKMLNYRYLVMATAHGWTLAEERDDGTLIRFAHSSRFKDLCCSFKTCTVFDPVKKTLVPLDPFECLCAIAVALRELTGIESSIIPNGNKTPADVINTQGLMNSAKYWTKDSTSWLSLADQIDKGFQVNYAIDDDVRQRVFGSTGDDEDEE